MHNIPGEVTKTVTIHAPAAKIWATLTEAAMAKQWMSPDSPIYMFTDWKAGSPVIIRGPWYKTYFEAKGTVLHYDPPYKLAYTHLSSLSRLPDEVSSYTLLTFTLATLIEDTTTLSLTISNFPTEAIYHHMNFYWGVALQLLKKQVEASQSPM